MASDPRSSKPGAEGRAREGYHSPELRIFGDIRTITRTGTGMGKDDMGGPMNTKTA